VFTVFVPDVTRNKRALSCANRRIFPATKCFMAHKKEIPEYQEHKHIKHMWYKIHQP